MDQSEQPFLQNAATTTTKRFVIPWKVVLGIFFFGGVWAVLDVPWPARKHTLAPADSVMLTTPGSQYILGTLGSSKPNDEDLVELTMDHPHWHLVPQDSEFGTWHNGQQHGTISSSGATWHMLKNTSADSRLYMRSPLHPEMLGICCNVALPVPGVYYVFGGCSGSC